MESPQCRFGDGEAVARISLSRGCWCYPADTEQDLCLYHACLATPLGTMELIQDYTSRKRFTKWFVKEFGIARG